jgi:3',5'-cyclic AMP phosphodiesterase CpdA
MRNYMSNVKRYIVYILIIILMFIPIGCTSSSIAFKEDYKIKAGEGITIYTATDLHYLADSLTDKGEAFKRYISSGDGKQLEYIDEILKAFTANIQSTKPDILILSGDLTNNGEKESHLELSKKLNTIEESGTSVYVIPGNHDILNPWARRFKGDKQYLAEGIDDRDFSKIYGDFGYNEAILRDKETLSYLTAPSEELWLLMLDTNKYKNNVKRGSPQGDGEISENTLDWIKKCIALAEEKGASITTVMHHSILNHSEVIQNGYTLDNNEEVIKVLKDNKLKLVLSGHIHVQDISSDNRNGEQLYDIATGSLAVYPHQYGTLKYSAGEGSFNYSTSRVDVENWSRNEGVDDEVLNNFQSYSEEYFGKFAYDMAYKHLIMDEGYTKEEMRLMSDTMKILNLRYFAGTEGLNSKDVINSQGYKLWLDSGESFQKKYIQSIFSDKDTEDNNLIIKIKYK